MSHLRRFLHLEGRRKARDSAAPAEPSASSRFATLEQPASAAPEEAFVPPATVQRFERQVSDPPLATDERALEEQPFLRCMHCQIDSSRYAQVCPQCGSSLTAPEQQEFNRALWEQRLRYREEEAKAQEEASRVRAEQQAELEAAYRQLERRSRPSGETPLGIWLLRRIADPRWRIGVIVGGLLAYAVFSVVELRGGRPSFRLWLLVTLGLVALFTPPRMLVTRRRRWYDDF
jgi:hypothetical protein